VRVQFAAWLSAGSGGHRIGGEASLETCARKSVAWHSGERGGLKELASHAATNRSFTLNEAQLQGLPYATRSNLVVYNAIGASDGRTQPVVLVQAYMPFSCAHCTRLVRVPAASDGNEGGYVYAVA
jgi:hypothetical protein